MLKHKTLLIVLFIIFIVSFAMRFGNLSTPFWVDEFSTASQAKIYLNANPALKEVKEKNNYLTNFLTSVSFRIFGVSTDSARYPSVLFGSLVPVALFLLAKAVFDTKTALFSTLFAIFSYFQITWSKQARGYALQQLLLVLLLLSYTRFITKKEPLSFFVLILISILGIATHLSFALVIGSLLLHFVIHNKSYLQTVFKKPHYFLPVLLLILSPLFLNLSLISSIILKLGSTNNLLYYHRFLWREQTVVSFLSILGILFLILKKKQWHIASLIAIPLAAYLFFFSFIFSPYVTRYLLPIFPLLLLLAGVAIAQISTAMTRKYALLIGICITVGIIANGDTFTLKPKSFYSVNNDMREIALLDYDAVYQIIKTKGDLDAGNTAVIDTWTDRSRWYLGHHKDYYYNFRWANEDGLINGLEKRIDYVLNSENEKKILNSGNPPVTLISELSDLKKAMEKYPKGFIWIDDTSLPKDVIEYVQTNFTKELYLDHFPLDSNPYSIWPGTLYSWGFAESSELTP
jgi:uncharacterized membrane protein